MTNFADFFNECMDVPEFRKEYDALETEFRVIQAILDEKRKAQSNRKGSIRLIKHPFDEGSVLEMKTSIGQALEKLAKGIMKKVSIAYGEHKVSISFDPELKLYVGSVENTSTPVTFYAREISELENEFVIALNAYEEVRQKQAAESSESSHHMRISMSI